MRERILTLGVLTAGVLTGQVFRTPAGEVRLDEGFGSQVVKGKPFSATEERRSLQILGDGTRIENNQTNRIYRDSEGRTRVEQMNGLVTINDPVEGVRVEIDPVSKAARRVSLAPALPVILRASKGEATETLRPQMVNGVMADGVRTTMTIPRGEIGNDRDIRVVTERWTSRDLQVVVKSTNSDPRFGETLYQLTGIAAREPDAVLFRIPETRATKGRGRGN